MRIQYAPYELMFRHVKHPVKREGALLKFFFQNEQVGYADCHPWIELGDLSLAQQLKLLKHNRFTSITKRASQIAQIDAKGRREEKNLFASSPILRSHFLVTHLCDLTADTISSISEQGFSHIKLKMGNQFEQEIQQLKKLFQHTSFKIRLDFNEKLTFERFLYFLDRIQDLKSNIDFIEDPFPFHIHQWRSIQEQGWQLACDKQFHAAYGLYEAASILIIKPAIQEMRIQKENLNQTCIVTSYLGHPLDQLAAAYFAIQIDVKYQHNHGLLSHQVYEKNDFSQHLNWNNAQFKFPLGTGFGFDDELAKLNWLTL